MMFTTTRIVTAETFLLLLSYATDVYSLLEPPCVSPLGLDYARSDHSLTFDLAVSSGETGDIRMNGPSAWSPANISGSFIEINISQPVLLTALQIQGDPQFTGQITGWLLDTSFDCENYRTEIYSLDQVTPVHTQTVYMKSLEFVSCIRLRPTHFKGKVPALRLELLGCVFQDISMCDRDVHPTTEIWMDDGGRQLNFAHEIVLSWIKILLDLHAHGDSVDTGIFYSRSCDKWNYYEPSDTSVISVTSSDEKSSWMTIELDKPVRAKCLRIFPPFASTLREVHTSGCNSHLMSSIHELMDNTKLNAYGKESMLQDIAAYQKDAPHVSHDTESTLEDDRSVKDKLLLIHEKVKPILLHSDNKIQEKISDKETDVSKTSTFDDVSLKGNEFENVNVEDKTSFKPVAVTATSDTVETTAAEAHNLKEITTKPAQPSQKLSLDESATVTLTTILYNSEPTGGNNSIMNASDIGQDINLIMSNHSTNKENKLILQLNSVEHNRSSENVTTSNFATNEQHTDMTSERHTDMTSERHTDMTSERHTDMTSERHTDMTGERQITEEHFSKSNTINDDNTNQSSTIKSDISTFGGWNGSKNDKYEEPGDVTLDVSYTVQQPDSTSSPGGLHLGMLASNESQSNALKNKDQNQTECGQKSLPQGLRRKRVVSGNINLPGEWPWLVTMHYLPEYEFTRRSGFKHICGATLIAPNWILTAAHCFSDDVENGLGNLTSWRVYFGMHDLAREDNQEFVQMRFIEEVYTYPEYDIMVEPLIFDIALVKLNESVEFNERVSPVCLDDTDIYYEESECFISGWGQLTQSSPGSRYPYSVALSIMTLSNCKNKYEILPDEHPIKDYVRIEPPVLCATVGSSGEDACRGDSGGPLMCERDGRWHQAGIVAAGYLCGHDATPGLYTRISYYRDWIRETMELYDDS